MAYTTPHLCKPHSSSSEITQSIVWFWILTFRGVPKEVYDTWRGSKFTSMTLVQLMRDCKMHAKKKWKPKMQRPEHRKQDSPHNHMYMYTLNAKHERTMKRTISKWNTRNSKQGNDKNPKYLTVFSCGWEYSQIRPILKHYNFNITF